MAARCVRQSGFTLIELMIAVAVIAILAAIAMPAYNQYIQTSQEGVLVSNIATLEVFQEDFRLRNGTYAVNLADQAAIEAALDWDIDDDPNITYSIANSAGNIYRVTATHADGTTVCLEYPGGNRCP